MDTKAVFGAGLPRYALLLVMSAPPQGGPRADFDHEPLTLSLEHRVTSHVWDRLILMLGIACAAPPS